AIHVINCTRLTILPESIGKLKKLRTLELNDTWNSLTLEGSNEQLLSSGCFFHPHHASHAPGNKASPSLCIADVKPRHITRLKLGRMTESSSGWEMLQHLTGLHDLEITGCKDLKQLPESMSLRRLELKHCDNLCMLPEWLGELQSLQSLDIINLRAMSALPEPMQRLTSLRSLFIFVCDALRQLPEQLGELCSLADLVIVDVPALTHLPESMRRLTSLRYLNLASCGALTQLPESLGELSALLRLGIQSCSGLTSLPRFIGRLTAPEELTINKCPELVRRCREGVGEDWHLISHVPELRLLD
uniref:Uncharacterized protein n=1 Tax=Setaria italica TaxID=4555 RepID=K3ZFF1_SETIT